MLGKVHSANGGRGRAGKASVAVRLAVLFALAQAVLGQTHAQAQDKSWIGTWTAAQEPTWGADFALPIKIPASASNQTFRQVVKISLGGSRLRFMFSNTFGSSPLRIGAASVALPARDGNASAGTLHQITFGGEDGIVVPPGAPAISDPVNMTVGDGAKLIVSTWLPNKTPLETFHWDGRATAWFANGNLTRSATFPTADKTDARILLSDVLIEAPNNGAVVVIGDSITDGNGATIDADTRWPDFLAQTLASRRVAVLNAGISGGRLLEDRMGVNAVARLEPDVFSKPNVKAIILMIGINDISWPGTAFARGQQRPTADAMIAQYRQVVALAHAHNVRVVGATLPPFEGALSGTPLGDYYSVDKDELRARINRWMKESSVFDAVVDFDAILRDPAHPARLLPVFDSGDHLHPSDKGNAVMAQAIDPVALLGR